MCLHTRCTTILPRMCLNDLFHDFKNCREVSEYKSFDISQLQLDYSSDRKTHCKPSGNEKVQVGKDQEKAQSEKDSHSKNRGGKKPN